jgi:hypothetical protein
LEVRRRGPAAATARRIAKELLEPDGQIDALAELFEVIVHDAMDAILCW